jgi:hypothetical protein
MSLNSAISMMSILEFALWVTLGYLFLKKSLHRRFPAMGTYLALHVASFPVLLFLLYGQSQRWHHFFDMYFLLYYAVYIASAVILYFVCVEVFRSALASFTGLKTLGIVVFRWVALASVIISFSTISFSQQKSLFIAEISYRLMRSVSILEICLLAFLCLSMNALRLSVRDVAFGIAMGFGLLSVNDFIFAALNTRYASMATPLQVVYEAVILATLGMWTSYCALPERARQPLMMPVNSTIFRWNEIAAALGHTGTQVAVQPAGGGFVLTDVEKAFEKSLTGNRE